MLLDPTTLDNASRERTRPAPVPGSNLNTHDAWILLGDLDAALYQSGVVAVWLEKMGPPSEIFAGGFSALNAVLAREHDPLTFRIGWERVRAAHVLAEAAVQSSAVLRYVRNGRQEPIDVGRLFSRTVLRSEGSTLHLLVVAAFVDVTTEAKRSLASLIEETLNVVPPASALAVAIDTAVAHGCTRILVPGIEERRIGQREVARAIEDARAHGADVVFLPLSTRQRPGVLGYLLPGLGRADRLSRDGRRAALRWLEASEAAVAGTQGSAPSS